MSTVTATCGHDVTDEFVAATVVVVKAANRECEHAISVRTACAKCREEYERVGLILHTAEEENAWLRGVGKEVFI